MTHNHDALPADPDALPADPYTLLSRDDAASILGVHVVTIGRMVKSGRLRGVRLGRRLKIPAGALRSLIDGDEQPALPNDHWPPTMPLW